MKQRDFGFLRYVSEDIDDPINPKKQSLAYIDNKTRFSESFVEQEQLRRQQQMSRQDLKIKHLREERTQRDKDRIDMMAQQREYEKVRCKQLQQSNKALRNEKFR